MVYIVLFCTETACFSPFSVAISKCPRLSNLSRVEVSFAHDSAGCGTQEHGTSVFLAFGEEFMLHQLMVHSRRKVGMSGNGIREC